MDRMCLVLFLSLSLLYLSCGAVTFPTSFSTDFSVDGTGTLMKGSLSMDSAAQSMVEHVLISAGGHDTNVTS